jgi:prephenate dehydrogenase
MGSAMTSPTEGEQRRRALVVGTGLIGGSIALGLRRRGWHVSGVDSDAQRAGEALATGAVDALGDDRDAEVVFVAVPAGAVAGEVARVLSDPGRRADAVVTDVSGVKAAIVQAADHPRFIGGHPMAGSEQIGLHGADADLFEGAVWVLTPTPATDLEAFDRLKGVVLSLGADALVLSPADHDRLVAVVSHVPHLVAATLMNAASAGAEQDGALLRLAAGGFRDMTRVAAGHPDIWPDICAENAAAIAPALDALVADLQAMRTRVVERDRGALLDELQRASAARQNLPARVARPDHLAELRIPVPDRAGVLAEITSLAADAGIGIYDIEIAHSAEGPRGVLILVVDGTDAATLSAAVEKQGYRCRAEELS